jgi:uncharacterized iron-regulated membrane protein
MTLRQLWLRVHRWTALSIGWLLILSGFTGAVLVAAQPLDQWWRADLYRARTPGPPQAPLHSLVERARAEFGPATTLTLRPVREAGESLRILVRGDWSGTLFVDPVTGAEQGRRAENEGFVNQLFKLHSALWLQETGKAILAMAALVYMLLLSTGLVLWWPRRWPPSWRIALDRGLLRALFDLHRVGGAALGLLVAVSVASGAYMAWRPLGVFVSALAGATPTAAPRLPQLADAGPAPTLDELAATAQARFPQAPIGYIQLPARADRPVRVRLQLPDDPHPNGLSSVWLDPRNGAVLAVQRWSELDPGASAVAWVYPLHTGVLGGLWLELAVATGGLVLATLGVSGIWLWWRRRAARRAAPMTALRQSP